MSRRRFGAVATSSVAVALLALIVVSPLALKAAAAVNLNWPLISNVGQAYGAASSILAGLALVGVAASTMLQARQTRTMTEQSARDLQLQILELAMRDEELRACIHPTTTKQHLYTNIYMMYQRMRLQIHDGDFGEFAAIAYDSFQGEAGRAYWTRARAHFFEHWMNTRFNRQFVNTLEDAYRRALADHPDPISVISKPSLVDPIVCVECGSLVERSASDKHAGWHAAEAQAVRTRQNSSRLLELLRGAWR